MNENEIGRIAAAANALRPDWPLASLRTLLNKPELVNRPRRDVAVALAWVACETQTKTPARVLEAGPWWQATNTEGRARTSFNVACPEHAGEILPCGRCAAARVPADNHAARLRAELASARSNLCPCGVKPNDCAAHDPRRNQPETEAAGPEESDHA
jgi:hypothetical protein